MGTDPIPNNETDYTLLPIRRNPLPEYESGSAEIQVQRQLSHLSLLLM